MKIHINLFLSSAYGLFYFRLNTNTVVPSPSKLGTYILFTVYTYLMTEEHNIVSRKSNRLFILILKTNVKRHLIKIKDDGTVSFLNPIVRTTTSFINYRLRNISF